MAHAAAWTKATYVAALYQRLAARLDKKRAILAVAHAIAVSAFHMLARLKLGHYPSATCYGGRRSSYLAEIKWDHLNHEGEHGYDLISRVECGNGTPGSLMSIPKL
jgi:hypothetical protein